MIASCTKALPGCLARRAADDREDALYRAASSMFNEMPSGRTIAHFEHYGEPPTMMRTAFDAALAEIQRTQAEAVYEAAKALPAGVFLGNVARRAAEYAFNQCAPKARLLSLTQRARLLDVAREATTLSIEVAA